MRKTRKKYHFQWRLAITFINNTIFWNQINLNKIYRREIYRVNVTNSCTLFITPHKTFWNFIKLSFLPQMPARQPECSLSPFAALSFHAFLDSPSNFRPHYSPSSTYPVTRFKAKGGRFPPCDRKRGETPIEYWMTEAIVSSTKWHLHSYPMPLHAR